MTKEVAIPLGFDLALASPTFDLIFTIYDSIEVQPYTGALMRDVFGSIKG